MTVEHIIPCVCSKPDGEYVSSDYGMPQLKVHGNYIKHKQFWQIYCPNCGRSGCREYKSPYLALKDWNEMQKQLYEYKKKEIVIHDRDYWANIRDLLEVEEWKKK